MISEFNIAGVVYSIAGREYAAAAAAADPYLGHSIGPVAGYGVSSPINKVGPASRALPSRM